MRLYEYKCGCGEKAVSAKEGPPLCKCGIVMTRDYSSVNIAFHGAGFYVNDSRPQ